MGGTNGVDYDKIYQKREGPTMVTTKKDDTGAIVILSITQVKFNDTKNEKESVDK